MAKVSRHVELEESHINAIRSAFGAGVSLSYVLNELLFHFHNIIQEKEINVSTLLIDAAERTYDSLES